MITRFIAMKNHINFRFVEVEDIAGVREYIVLRVSGRSTIAPLNGRNHPKRAAFYMTFLLVNFAVKNAMFN